jgi:hypothetical protein
MTREEPQAAAQDPSAIIPILDRDEQEPLRRVPAGGR